MDLPVERVIDPDPSKTFGAALAYPHRFRMRECLDHCRLLLGWIAIQEGTAAPDRQCWLARQPRHRAPASNLDDVRDVSPTCECLDTEIVRLDGSSIPEEGVEEDGVALQGDGGLLPYLLGIVPKEPAHRRLESLGSFSQRDWELVAPTA